VTGKGLKIMIIEDNKSFLETIQDLLETKDFQVAAYTEGRNIAQNIAKEKPDLLMLDINLPGEDGFSICRQIKSAPETRALPIILMTGDATIDIDKGFALGADDCIFKPFDIDDVIARIKKLARRDPRVLLVEDDRKICEMVTAMLAEKHYDAKAVNDGRDIINVVKGFSPDLILLDISLQIPPDGIEICRLLKSDSETRKTPVVMLTANEDADSIEKCFAFGADDYLFKPFKTQDLLLRIKKYIEYSKNV